jgi:hypothetical protein
MVELKFSRNVHLAWTPRRQAPAAVAHGVKSLPLWGAAIGVWFLHQGGAARRQPCRSAAGSFLFFLVLVFKTLLTF